jgi:transcriptional regulator with XRE-family HTH domain
MPKSTSPRAAQELRDRFAANLRAALEDAGLTQADLARMIGVSPGSIGNWCQATAMPSVEHLVEIARIVRQSVSWLVGDRLYGTDSLESLEHELAVRLGGDRLRSARHIPDSALLGQFDLLADLYPPTGGREVTALSARRDAKRKRK